VRFGLQTERMKLAEAGNIQRHPIDFFYGGIPVCNKFYFFVHAVGRKRFKNIVQHYQRNGIMPRVNQNTGKAAKRHDLLPFEDREAAVNFIKTYAEKFAISLPGRYPGHKEYRALKLPAADTKLSVYKKYVKAREQIPDSRIMGSSSFFKLWTACTPHIYATKPSSDLCNVCRLNVRNIQRAGLQGTDDKNDTNPDTGKEAAVHKATEHLNRAKRQREWYNTRREQAAQQETLTIDGITGTFRVLSFDFAEQVHYPSNPAQVGPMYFKTPRKCSMFGMQDEKTHVQTNYLIDEEDEVGKGADTVISLIHHYLSEQDDVDILVFFADNCVGQNKNNALLKYFQWRVATQKNKVIEYNFMLAGHTKFGPDRNFGIVKFKYARTVVDCLEDLIACVEQSSRNGFNKAVATVDPVTKERVVTWSYWTEFLKGYFTDFRGLTQYHHFTFYPDGRLEAKLFADSPASHVKLQTASLHVAQAQMIEDKIPAPLSAARQWYLFREIRDFCDKDANMDKVAPQPSVPEPKRNTMEKTEYTKTRKTMREDAPERPAATSTPKRRKTSNTSQMEDVGGQPTLSQVAANNESSLAPKVKRKYVRKQATVPVQAGTVQQDAVKPRSSSSRLTTRRPDTRTKATRERRQRPDLE
jgi:hypothetical protein